jgi:hypothetical protein
MSIVDLNPPEPSPAFEIDLMIKDAAGRPTGKRKLYGTDSAYKLWQFWMRHQGRPKRKKGKLPSGKEAEKIMNNLYGNG